MNALMKKPSVVRNLAALKRASVGSSPDIPYEQAFANIAHEFIRSRAPSLMDYEIGFQLIDRSKEGEKALGAFGFQAGDRLLLIPVIYHDGEVKGHEIIYVPDQNICVPSSEAWVSYLTQKQPDSIGEGVVNNRSALGVRGPALALITRSPLKFASEHASKVAGKYAEWCHPMLAWFAKIATATEQEQMSWAPSVGELLAGRPFSEQIAYMKLLDMYPGLKQAAEKLNQELYPELEKNIDAAIDRSKLPRIFGSVLGEPKKPVKALKITYYHEAAKAIVPYGLTDKDREKLVRDGYLITDKRKDDQKPTLHIKPTEKETLSVQNPTSNGIKDVLVRPGKFERCLVLVEQIAIGRRPGQSVAVIRMKDKRMLGEDRNGIFVDNDAPDVQEMTEFLEGLKTVSSTKFDTDWSAKYIILHREGPGIRATCCFNVNRNLGKVGKDTVYDVSSCHDSQHERSDFGVGTGDREAKDKPEVHFKSGPTQIRVSDDISSIKFWAGEIVVPADAKVLKVDNSYRSQSQDDFQVADAKDLAAIIWKDLSRLEVHRNFSAGREYRINTNEPVTKSSAVLHLVEKYELPEQEAVRLLDSVEKGSKIEAGVKKADNPVPWLIDEGKSESPDIPNWNTPVGSNVMTNPNVENDATTTYELPVDGLMASRSDPSNWDPRVEPHLPYMQQAMQAARTGQRDLFNTKSVLSIVNKDQSGDMGPIIKCMDSLGRRYLAFCWQREAMNDQYGSADASDIEDGLIENFENIGEMTIAMYERDIKNGDHSDLLKARLTIHSEDVGGTGD